MTHKLNDMDEDSLHSEIIDSLDYLIPPIKKACGTLERDLFYTKDFRKRLTRQIKTPLQSEDVVHTSSSVILKKTTKKFIHEQYSILNLKSQLRDNSNLASVYKEYKRKYLIEEKPTIRVTVIPKVAETQTSKVFNKRRQRLKKIQSTVSNHENSIKSQNLCLMVKGKKCEKVYEIKTTESTNLSNKLFNSKYDDLSIEQVSDSIKLIKSLNMEKKKRNENRSARPIINERTEYHYNFRQVRPRSINKNESKKYVNGHTSKVTIVGQVGLTQNDQYVLKCAATVNDKPIITDFQQIQDDARNDLSINKGAKAFSSKFERLNLDEGNKYRRFRQEDSNVQTDIWYANKCFNLETNKYPKMVSQATQVDLNFSRNKALKNQIAQCENSNANMNINYINNESEVKKLKKYESPLVIISVYPRHDKDTNVDNSVKIIEHQSYIHNKMMNNNNNNYIPKENKRQQIIDNFKLKPEKKNFRSRSPSPVNKSFINKPIEKNIIKEKNRLGNKRPQSQTHFNKSANKNNNTKKDVSCNCPISTCLKHDVILKKEANNLNSNHTNAKQVKRDLVNNFLKSINRNEANLKLPKENKSRIAIDLDGDKEHYDVLFEQRNLNTGVTIRKTLKNQTQTYSSEDEVDINSMENFLTLSDEKTEMNKKAIYSREAHDVSTLLPTESRLNARDSLELCHSRDDRVGSRLKHISRIGVKNTLTGSLYNSDFLAPIKHYRGDDCSLSDPNERDKEIRELLGIIRNKQSPEDDTHERYKDNVRKSFKDKGCCCRRKCRSKGLMTGLNMSKFFASKCLKRKSKNPNEPIESKKLEAEAIKDNTTHKSSKKHSIQETTKRESTKVSPPNNEPIMNDTTPDTSDSPHKEPPSDPPIENHKQDTEKQKSISHTKQIVSEKSKKNAPSEMPVLNKDEGSSSTDDTHKHKEPIIEQNLILNRNIQVFLQIEQFTKQRPIMLTRKQYDKVKKTIQCTISKKLSLERRQRCSLKNCNVISVGEIKVKPKLQQLNSYDREVQTDRSEIQKSVRCIHIQTQRNYKNKITKNSNIKQNIMESKLCNKSLNTSDNKTDITISTNKYSVKKHLKPKISTRNTVSSMEIRYANVAFKKHITISSTQFGDGLHNRLDRSHFNCNQKASNSIHTIFKGHRKSATPNLGTSAYSLYSNTTIADDLTGSVRTPDAGDSKPKRPFLQRLISCLVMRPAETSILKEVLPIRKQPSVNSSIDSYRISTSLGGLEMTSSIYDTSASFHSNHTTVPINKMKKGFFSSVRGFLANRRS